MAQIADKIEKISEIVTEGYRKIEDGESVEDAKKSLTGEE